jgi:fatty acid-binding protein DegV
MIKAVRKDLEERFRDPDGDNFYMEIAHTANDAEAQIFKKELEEEFPGHDIWVDPLSLSVSCHIGPGALAFAVSKKVEELS